MLIAVVVVLFPNYLLHGQEKIWQTDPDYFESFPEEQLEEWTDLLWSLKSANLVWPEKVNALKAFPWVDYTWIESSLLTQSNIIISELLLSVYADEPTKATIEWLYDIKAHKRLKFTNLNLIGLKISMLLALREVNFPSLKSKNGCPQIISSVLVFQQMRCKRISFQPKAIYINTLVGEHRDYWEDISHLSAMMKREILN